MKTGKFLVFIAILLKLTCPDQESFIRYLSFTEKNSILYQTAIKVAKTIKLWEYKHFWFLSIVHVKKRRVFGFKDHVHYLGVLNTWFQLPNSVTDAFENVVSHLFSKPHYNHNNKSNILTSSWNLISLWSSSILTNLLVYPLKSIQTQFHDASVYHRLYQEITEYFGLIELLITINVIIFVMWQILPEEYMLKHYACSYWQSIRQSKYFTLISANFSHQQFFHLLNNMYGLIHYGPQVLDLVGPKKFLAFYMVSTLSTTLTSVFIRHFVTKRQDFVYSLGASGCVIALRTFIALFQAQQKHLFVDSVFYDGIHQHNNYFGSYGQSSKSLNAFREHVIGHLLVEAIVTSHALVDVGGHFGGFLVGLAYFFFTEKRQNENLSLVESLNDMVLGLMRGVDYVMNQRYYA